MNNTHFKLPQISSLQLTIIISFIFAIVFNLRIMVTYLEVFPLDTFSRGIEAIAFFLFIFSLIMILFTLFNFKYLQKPLIIISLLFSAGALYFSLRFNTLFDVSMLNNALETDTAEALDLLSLSFITMFLLVGVLPSILVFYTPIKYPKRAKSILYNSLTITLSVLLIVAVISPYYAQFSSFVRNNNTKLKNSLLPFSPVYSLYKNARHQLSSNQLIIKKIDKTAKIQTNTNHQQSSNKPQILIVIVGETARASSFTALKKQWINDPRFINNDPGLIYFTNTTSCGTNTAASLPCMFFTDTQDSFNSTIRDTQENIAEMIQRIGYEVSWIDNNSGCKGVCDSLNTLKINNAASSADGRSYDERLIPEMLKKALHSKNNQLIILHQMGSHGPAYFKRVPKQFKLIQPACESKDFGDCSQQEIINAYDNSVLYSNHIIAKTIKQLKTLKESNTALIYLSDHGESTGEGGYYLHGIPYFIAPDEQTHIPMLMWFSDGYAKQKTINLNCLKTKQNNAYSHDNFSHSLLGLLNIQSEGYNEELDILSECRD